MTHRMKLIAGMMALLLLAACVVKPPVQEMAEARSAVKMAQELMTSHHTSSRYLQRAKQALTQASQAIEEKKYDKARSKALESKRQAQQAARSVQKE